MASNTIRKLSGVRPAGAPARTLGPPRGFGPGLLAALLVVASAAAVPVDALLDADLYGSQIHVETPDNRHCQLRHGHAVCQVLRSLSDVGLAPTVEAEPPELPSLRVREVSDGARLDRSPPSLFGGGVPRAPPGG